MKTPKETAHAQTKHVDVAIIGGGPAGLAAAIQLYQNGIHNIIIIEREKQLGGILRQCIHDGFGLTRFSEMLSGPEYAQAFIDQVETLGVPYLVNASVVHFSPEKHLTVVTPSGLQTWDAKAVILTTGCRERTRGALGIPGDRPVGVFTAGVAQAYINLYNRMPAKEVVILGSGDIGLIMARRLTLEGAHVQAIFEIQPYPNGLPRNIQQCANDYHIPLYLNHTVTQIHGRNRLTGVTVSQVDKDRQPIAGTDKFYPCDTLILSVGLIPENELSREAGVALDPRTNGPVVNEFYQTSLDGVFVSGNVLQVHDLVDYVSLEAERMAGNVTAYLHKGALPESSIRIVAKNSIGYTVPQRISGQSDFLLSLRVSRPLTDCRISVCQDGKEIAFRKLKKAIPAQLIQLTVSTDKLSSGHDLEVSAHEN